ncbi:MAG TPA: YraN family protein [Acidimicrobiales bacterium]|nr:YraN family protein [Acidimicrobiales bacterium]
MTGDGRRAYGESGEALAAAWYEAAGYEVVARNWRCREGELDLVVRRGRTIVFCEVKARRTTRFGTPGESITHEKKQRIRHLAARWLREASGARPGEIRFDVAAVLDGRVEVVQGAF